MLSKLPKKIACAFLVAAMLASSSVSVGAANAMAAGHWAEKEINAFTDAGYITETTDPDTELTVKEFSSILSAITGEEIDAMAADETALSREFAFELLGKLTELSSENSDALSAFTDADAIIESARDEIAAMVSKGYIKGKGDSTLDPDAGMTIAEFATMYSRLKYILAADADGYVYGTARLTWEQFWANEGITYDDSIAFDAVNETTDSEGMTDLGGFDAVTRATSKHGIYRGAAHYSYLIHGADEAGNTANVYLEDMTDADTVADMYGAGKNFYGVNGSYQITQPESGEYTTYIISTFEVVGYKAWPVKMLASDAEKLADSMNFVLDSSVTAETGRVKTISAADNKVSAGKAAEASGKTYVFDGKINLTYDDSYGDYIFAELGSISDTEWGMNLLGATYEYYGETDPSAEGAAPIATYGTKYGADTWWKSNGKTLHLGINTSYRHGGEEQYGYWKINIMSAGYEDVSVVIKALPAYAAEVTASIADDNKTVTVAGITDADWANTTVSVDGAAVEMKNGSAVIEGMAVGAHTVTINIDGYREITDEIIVDSGLTAADITLTGNKLTVSGGDIANYLSNVTGIAVDGKTLSGNNLGSVVFNEDGTVNFDAAISSRGGSTVVFAENSNKSYMLIISAAGYPSVVLNTEIAESYVYGTARLTWEQFWANEDIDYASDVDFSAVNETTDKEGVTDLGGFDAVTRATAKHGVYRGIAHYSYLFHAADKAGNTVDVYVEDIEDTDLIEDMFGAGKNLYCADGKYYVTEPVEGEYAVYTISSFEVLGYTEWPVKILYSQAEAAKELINFQTSTEVTEETGRLKTVSITDGKVEVSAMAEANGAAVEYEPDITLEYNDSYGDYIFVQVNNITDTDWGMNLLGVTYDYFGDTDPSTDGAEPVATYGSKYGADTWWKSNGKTLHLGINTSYRHGGNGDPAGAEKHGYWRINIMSDGYEDYSLVVYTEPAYSAEVTASIASDGKTITLAGIADADLAKTAVSVDGTAAALNGASAVIDGLAIGAHTVTVKIDGYREITAEIIVMSDLTAADITLIGNKLTVNGGDLSNYLANITGIAVDGTTLSGSDLGNVVFNADGAVNFAAEIASRRSSTVVFPEGSGKSYMLIISAAGYPSVILNTEAAG